MTCLGCDRKFCVCTPHEQDVGRKAPAHSPSAEAKPLRFAHPEEARQWLAENGLQGFVSEAGRGCLACVVVGDGVWAYSSTEELTFLECW